VVDLSPARFFFKAGGISANSIKIPIFYIPQIKERGAKLNDLKKKRIRKFRNNITDAL